MKLTKSFVSGLQRRLEGQSMRKTQKHFRVSKIKTFITFFRSQHSVLTEGIAVLITSQVLTLRSMIRTETNIDRYLK